jgi:hypothetical protein
MTQLFFVGLIHQDWQVKKEANPHIQAVDIAETAGLSACRVHQILRFARIHPEIQKAILKLSLKQAKKRSPEGQLRQWTPLSDSKQLSQYRTYVN